MKKFTLLILSLVLSLSTMAQITKVSGKIIDEYGKPMTGVSIINEQTKKVAVSDIDGMYTIGAKDGETLMFNFFGMKDETRTVLGDKLDVTMITDSQTLDQLVVIGYGSVKKSDLTGSVATVKPEAIYKEPAASFEKLLSGRAAGVQVITGDSPGSGATIRIRGGSSVYSSNTPLLVVDGFPAGDAGNLKQIIPSDIESIEILKDASASAIYGSRGANGVIIVTTKRAKAGVTRVEVANQTSISQFTSNFDQWEDPMLMAQLSNESYTNAGMTPLYIGAMSPGGVYYPSLQEISTGAWPYWTDWASVVYRPAPILTNTTVSVGTANDKTAFNISVGLLTQEGSSIKDDYMKGNVNLSISHKISDFITVRFNDILSRDYRYSNSMYLRNPIFPVYDENGDYFLTGPQDFSHPLAIAENSYNYSNGFDNIAMLGVDVDIAKSLKFTTQANYKYGNSINDFYQGPKYTFEGYQRNGYAGINNWTGQDFTSESYLTFDKNWNDVHHLTVMGGFAYNYNSARSSNLTAEDFVNSALGNENLGSGKPEKQRVSNSLVASQLISWMARVNYTLLDKYLFTFTARADGSSKFAPGNQWAVFPSGAVSWKMHNEDFIKNLNLFNELKIRTSYGISGNQGISPYQTLPRYGLQMYYYEGAWVNAMGQGIIDGYEGADGRILIWGGFGNPNLKWETTSQFDIGLDLAMFDSRLRFNFDYYTKTTNDLLRDAFIPPSTSFDRMKVNDGSVKNEGVEFTLAGDIIRNANSTLTATAIVSHNKNTLVSLGDEKNIGLLTDHMTGMKFQYWGSLPSTFSETGLNILAMGQPINVFYGYRTNGIIQSELEGLEAGLTGDLSKPGELKYVDLNKDGTIDEKDKTIIGDPNPDFIASLAVNYSYKNFDFEVLFNSAIGGDIINTQTFGSASTQPLRWTKDNPNNDYPSLRQNRYTYKFSDYWVTDGSYVKIQNINVGYRFDFKTNWIESLRLSFNVSNVFTFSNFKGYDPAIGLDGIYWGGMPRLRQFTIGVSARF